MFPDLLWQLSTLNSSMGNVDLAGRCRYHEECTKDSGAQKWVNVAAGKTLHCAECQKNPGIVFSLNVCCHCTLALLISIRTLCFQKLMTESRLHFLLTVAVESGRRHTVRCSCRHRSGTMFYLTTENKGEGGNPQKHNLVSYQRQRLFF